MAVFAANITDKTVNLVEKVIRSNDLVRFSLQNELNLSDKTTLVRLALINLLKHIPSNEEVSKYKAALLRPTEFDNFLKAKLGVAKQSVP